VGDTIRIRPTGQGKGQLELSREAGNFYLRPVLILG